MLLVLSALRVFPDFYRYLRAFARKSFPRDEGFGGFDHLEASDSNGVPRSLGEHFLHECTRFKPINRFRVLLSLEICSEKRHGSAQVQSLVDTTGSHIPEGHLQREPKGPHSGPPLGQDVPAPERCNRPGQGSCASLRCGLDPDALGVHRHSRRWIPGLHELLG